LGAWLKMTGFLIPEVGLAGTVPCGLSGLWAALSAAIAQGPSPTLSPNQILVCFLTQTRQLF